MAKVISSILGLILIGVVTAGLMVVTKTGFTIIDGWEVGVKKSGTTYNMTELEPGYKLFIPIYEEITEINGRPILFNYSKSDANKESTQEIRYNAMIDGVDKNGIPISFALAIEVKPVKNMMSEMFQEDGTFENGLDKKVIQPNKSIVRDVMGSFDAKTIQSMRDKVSEQLNTRIMNAYTENKYFELVGSVDLKQIELPQAVKDGQIAVQLAAQDAERSAELIVKAENEAKAKAKTAEGTANMKRIESQGIADAITIEAEAQAKANKLINASLTENVLRNKWIKTWGENGAKVPYLVGSEKSQFIIPIDNQK